MNVDVIVATSEIIGAIAVVISLVYVGVQIRQNTVSQNALMHQQLVDSQNDTNRAITDNKEITELIEKANDDFESLSRSEVSRLAFVYFSFFNLWHVAFENHRRRMVETHVLEEWDRGYEFLFKTNNSCVKIWKQLESVYDPQFRERVEQHIQALEKQPA